ncbi:MAG: glycosyltransferase [Flavobacteriales bacterium]|jgi:glycosyltransferase involved in cell wall biosynthesis|nr:glycosyltransferase [Flavobacteriales bacterium]
MNILIIHNSKIPVHKYGGTERVIWYLGKELVALGHQVKYIVPKGSSCDFAEVIERDEAVDIHEQIPKSTDIVHYHYQAKEIKELKFPYVVTVHGNRNHFEPFAKNSIFVSENHANRYGSDSFVHNGLDWEDYGEPNLDNERSYFHFLGNAAWKVKNVKGAIATIKQTQKEQLKVLGGKRINFKMGVRFTLSSRISFEGMVGGETKNKFLNGSKGLVFPVRWSEPFGLAITESLYFGCPVFGTPYGSLSEIVTEKYGYLSANKLELAAAIENNTYDRQACHEYAKDFFNSKVMAAAYLKKYALVLEGRDLNKKAPKLLKQGQKLLPWEN